MNAISFAYQSWYVLSTSNRFTQEISRWVKCDSLHILKGLFIPHLGVSTDQVLLHNCRGYWAFVIIL